MKQELTFRLWLPGKAPAATKSISKEERCKDCNGTGEEEGRSKPGVGRSYLRCQTCQGEGMKILEDA